MKLIPSLLIFLLFTNLAYAGRVLIKKSDGYPIEYQSTNANPGTLLKNNPQYSVNDVEEKEITPEQWAALREKYIVQPAENSEKNQALDAKKRLQAKYGWTDQDINDIVALTSL